MKQTGRLVLSATVLASALFVAPAKPVHAQQLFCRWGKPAKMAPVPKCGIPRELEVKVPPNTWKLYFLRSENPGLSGYFHQGRAPGARPRVFMRKINLVNVVLMLCPKDFKTEKVLAFQRMNNQRRMVGRPTCRLGPPSGKPPEPRPAVTSRPGTRPGPDVASKPAADPGTKAPAAAGGTVYDAAAASQPKSAAAGSKPWKKIDRLARLLGLLSLALALCAIVALVVVYRFFSRKLRRLEEES